MLDEARATRNKKWEQLLKAQLETEPSKAPFFISVGINHLLGETGIFKALERYGIQSTGITQLMANGDWRPI
ncbi:MAG: hypothetical protein H6925_00460 [Holosporaceae bacterium]|nr:MAG: hypothetical protein H6925_00460 [Holosporaceae bacterium]